MPDTALPSAAIQIAEQKAADYRETYANFARVGLSNWDIGMVFGIVNDAVAGEPASASVHTHVRMSPQQFKVFANALPAVMAAWEARFGEVNLSADVMVPQMDIQAAIKHALPPAPAGEAAQPAKRKRS